MKTYKERLKELREDTEPRRNQNEIAKIIGVTDSTYQNYEYGKTEPKVSEIIKLCKLYGVTADYLLGLSDKP